MKRLPLIASRQGTRSLTTGLERPMFADRAGNVWFGTFGDGLYRVDAQTGALDHFQHDPLDPSSLSENSLNSICEDRSGTLWFGTFGAGINKYAARKYKFDAQFHNPTRHDSLSSNFVWSMHEDRTGRSLGRHRCPRSEPLECGAEELDSLHPPRRGSGLDDPATDSRDPRGLGRSALARHHRRWAGPLRPAVRPVPRLSPRSRQSAQPGQRFGEGHHRGHATARCGSAPTADSTA